jgi:hypothetical protein
MEVLAAELREVRNVQITLVEKLKIRENFGDFSLRRRILLR